MRTINDTALKAIAKKYHLQERDLSNYIRQADGKNAFHLSVCIAQRFDLGHAWDQIRQIIHQSER